MSYGLYYTLTFREAAQQIGSTGNSNVLYQVNIYKSGFSGSAQNVIASDNPITLAYKKQNLISPIIGSELTLSLMSQTNGQFIEFASAAPLAFYADVLRSTDNGSTYQTYWSGVNTTDAYSEPYAQPPYAISLKFNCGLGELQFRRYENSGSLLVGNESVILTIANCLSFLPYQKNVREIINIREDNMFDTEGLLEQLYLNDLTYQEIADDGLMHGMPCQTILANILTSLNCRMYQSGNIWYVERIYERINTSFTYFDYTPTGVMESPGYTYSHIGTGTLNAAITIDNASQPKLVNGGDWQTTKKQPILLYDFATKAEAQELIPNPYFENSPIALNANGTPRNWDLGVDLAPANLQVKIVNPYTNNMQEKYGAVFNSTALNNFANAMKMYELANPRFNLGQWRGIGTNYGIHAVRKSGDTYTNPNLYIDPVNGSIEINIKHYYSFKIIANNANCLNLDLMGYDGTIPLGKPAVAPGGDAYNILRGGINVELPVHIYFWNTDGSHDWTLNATNIEAGGYGWVINSGLECTFSSQDIAQLNTGFPNPGTTGQAIPLTVSQLAQMIANAWTSKQPIYLNFISNYSVVYPLASMIGEAGVQIQAGMYAFDAVMYPCMLMNGSTAGVPPATSSNNPNTSLTLDSWGINQCSIQYKDAFANSIPFTKFYATSDYDLRWSELKVTPVYGDTLIPGYPEQFMLPTSNPTATWHTNGQQREYLCSLSTSGDPGSKSVSIDNADPTLAVNINIYVIDENNENNAGWLAGLVSGDLIVLSDESSTLQYVYQITGSPVSHSTYYAIPVVFISGDTIAFNRYIAYTSQSGMFAVVAGGASEFVKGETSGATAQIYYTNNSSYMTVHNITGTFTTGETIKGEVSGATCVFSSIGSDIMTVNYQGGQQLADMLFQNYTTLCGIYRRAIRGSILQNGGIGFWNSIIDEDGTIYVQTSNTFNFKKASLTIDLEETSAPPPTVTKITQSSQQSVLALSKQIVPTNPITQSSATESIAGGISGGISLTKSVLVLSSSLNTGYPTA